MIYKKKLKGLTVFVKDNDSFYENVLQDFLSHKINIKKILCTKSETKVWLIETERGLMVLKLFVPRQKRLERFLKSFIKRDYYENLIYRTDRAINNGLDTICDQYLLAEKKCLNYAYVYIMLIEYIEGTQFNFLKSIPDELKLQVKNLMDEIHENNIVSTDAHCGNFMLTKDGIAKAYDLSGKSCNSIHRAKDRIDLERYFDIKNEIFDFGYYWIVYRRKFRLFTRKIKYKLGLSKKPA